MVHCVFWLFSGGAPASQPARGGGGGRGGGFQSLPATQPRLGAAPFQKKVLVQEARRRGLRGWSMSPATL